MRDSDDVSVTYRDVFHHLRVAIIAAALFGAFVGAFIGVLLTLMVVTP